MNAWVTAVLQEYLCQQGNLKHFYCLLQQRTLCIYRREEVILQPDKNNNQGSYGGLRYTK